MRRKRGGRIRFAGARRADAARDHTIDGEARHPRVRLWQQRRAQHDRQQPEHTPAREHVQAHS
jgi:hypothetical protein